MSGCLQARLQAWVSGSEGLSMTCSVGDARKSLAKALRDATGTPSQKE